MQRWIQWRQSCFITLNPKYKNKDIPKFIEYIKEAAAILKSEPDQKKNVKHCGEAVAYNKSFQFWHLKILPNQNDPHCSQSNLQMSTRCGGSHHSHHCYSLQLVSSRSPHFLIFPRSILHFLIIDEISLVYNMIYKIDFRFREMWQSLLLET